MEQMMELIVKFGIPFVTMALIVVCLIGVVKIFTKGILNVKEVSETKKKWFSRMYLGLAMILSVIVTCFYYGVILKADWWSWAAAKDSIVVFTITSPLYEIYKQFGGRKLLIAFCGAVKKLFSGNKKAEQILTVVMSVLEKDAPLLTEDQKQAIVTDLTNDLKK